MAEYIEREKMLEDLRLQFCKGCNNYSEIRCKSCSIDDVIGFIEDEPTADVVPVVRCKDCVYWDGLGYSGRCEGYHNGLMRDYTNYDDYCSYGERRCSDG